MGIEGERGGEEEVEVGGAVGVGVAERVGAVVRVGAEEGIELSKVGLKS